MTAGPPVVRTSRVVSGDAVLALDRIRVNGGGPLVLFVHATGFCKEVWLPVVEDAGAAEARFDALLFDQRAHGASVGAGVADWWQLGRDVLTVLGGRQDVIGVGHSSGGAALVLAELLEPGTFGALLLVEPIVPGPPYEPNDDHPYVALASKRRRLFPSHSDAAASYRDRGPFVGWDERALAGYLEGGLRAAEGAFLLSCTPESEADFYRTASAHGAYERLGELRPPTEVMYGTETEDFGPEFYAEVASRIPGAAATEVVGASHFLPMQRPGFVAAAVVAAVGESWVPGERR